MRVQTLARHKTADGVLHLPGDEYECDAELAGRSAANGLVFGKEAADPRWWTRDGRVLRAEALRTDDPSVPPAVYAAARSEGSQTILSATTYDPGCSAYRLHSAVNECSPHASLFARFGDSNPHCSLRQIDVEADIDVLREAIRTANVVHMHMNLEVIELARTKWTGLLVRHYHGSNGTPRANAQGGSIVNNERDAELDVLQIGARLYHLGLSRNMHWLPIAIPVERYAALAREHMHSERPSTPYRVAHSPTVRRFKATDVFLDVCNTLREKGVAIEPVLIEKMSHADALVMRATCDATFDSFWLGLQGSGLEGAAMGQPVIAGDSEAAGAYFNAIGHVPYTFADNAAQLEEQLALLATDTKYRVLEAKRVNEYVREYHDYPAVAYRYAEILRTRIPNIAMPPKRAPLITHTPPPVKVALPPEVKKPKGKPVKTPRRKPPETR